MKLTSENLRDLRAINDTPGIYSRVPPETCAELLVLCHEGLVAWMEHSRGYMVTEAGRSALAAMERGGGG